MGGGLLQLVAYGAQDIYLTGNPQITLFKVVYRRPTFFSIESIKQTFKDNVSPGSKIKVKMERYADMLSKVWVNFNLTQSVVTSSTSIIIKLGFSNAQSAWYRASGLTEPTLTPGFYSIEHNGIKRVFEVISDNGGTNVNFINSSNSAITQVMQPIVIGPVENNTVANFPPILTNIPANTFSSFVITPHTYSIDTPISQWLSGATYNDNISTNHIQTSQYSGGGVYHGIGPYSGLLSLRLDSTSYNNTSDIPLIINKYNGTQDTGLFTNSLTIATHIKISAFGGDESVIYSTLTSNATDRAGFSLSVEGSTLLNGSVQGRLQVKYGSGQGNGNIYNLVASNNYLTTNVWYHIALVIEGSNLNKFIRLYVNGTEVAGSTQTTIGGIFGNSPISQSNDTGIYIGRASHLSNRFLNGWLSDLRHYDFPLTQAQIALVRNTLLVIPETVSASNDNFRFIEYVELQIGGQTIDKQYGEWMSIWCDLSHSKDISDNLVKLNTPTNVYAPLQFWFCRHPGLAIPLIALQYHEVFINIQFTSILPNDAKVEVWADYIFLGPSERKRYALESHEYLIETVQKSQNEYLGNLFYLDTKTCYVPLPFNHPVKEIVWVIKNNDNIGLQASNALLQLNNQDRFDKRVGNYFSKVQRYQYHTGSTDKTHLIPHIYSFAQYPEDYQPSGTCNFSKINHKMLIFDVTASQISNGDLYLNVYAHGYNVLRITSGMGGLAFAN